MYAANLNYQSTLNQTAKKSLLKIVRNISPVQKVKTFRQNNKLRILSIDGGGIRAILPAIILAELEEQLKKESGNPEASIINHFDLFAGTSAGSILITLYLTPNEDAPHKPKFTAKEVLELYLQDGCKCFTTTNPDASKARTEKYSATVLEEKLQELLGKETKMEQLLKPTLITAFNATTETPVYFESWNKNDCSVWQTVRASTAAPGLFSPAIVDAYDKNEELIDGSIFAGNPAMCAFALANNTRFSTISNCQTNADFPNPDEMIMLSLGTGKPSPIADTQKRSWLRVMMKNLMTSGIDLVNHQLNQIFSTQNENNYYRFNPKLPTNETIDNASTANIDSIYKAGIQYLKENQKTLEQLIHVVL